MKKVLNRILTATLICGTALLVSCKKDNDDMDVAGKIIGNWIADSKGGEPFLTNEKVVLNFISTNKALMSGSFSNNPAAGASWIHDAVCEVVIDGNKVSLTNQYDPQTITEIVFDMIYISKGEFTATQDFTIKINGTEVLNRHYVVHYVKENVDYTADIIGTWQGRCTSKGSAYDDGQEHRWQYLDNGTYVYYVKDGDNWVPGDNTVSEYFVAGSLLCTRWEIDDQSYREWWGISIQGNTMYWVGLRQDEGGKTTRVSFQMNKVLK